MDVKEQLKGDIKEVLEEQFSKSERDEIKALAEKNKEDNAKILEENKELKTKLEAWQGKAFNLNQNTGTHKYIFKGMDVNRPSRNFVMDVPQDVRDEHAKHMLNMLKSAASMKHDKALTTTGAYATSTEYGSALLGLGELTSVALAKATIYMVDGPILKLPNKATRATYDTQAFGTTNAAAATDLGQTTWTIDKRVGAYETLYNDVLADQIFDVVAQFVEPMIAEGIGQNADSEMFNTGGEFTTSITSTAGGTGVTASGTANIAAAITFANLNTMFNGVEWERGLGDCQWFGSRAALGTIRGLRSDAVSASDGMGLPIFQDVPINGRPSQTLMGCQYNIVPMISNTPANGAIRLAFGDPKYYVITVRNPLITFQANPYVGMKEGYTQFIGYARMDGNLTAANAFSIMKRNDA